jgi:hypothetical protein
MILTNLVTPKAAAKDKLFFNKLLLTNAYVVKRLTRQIPKPVNPRPIFILFISNCLQINQLLFKGGYLFNLKV